MRWLQLIRARCNSSAQETTVKVGTHTQCRTLCETPTSRAQAAHGSIVRGFTNVAR